MDLKSIGTESHVIWKYQKLNTGRLEREGSGEISPFIEEAETEGEKKECKQKEKLKLGQKSRLLLKSSLPFIHSFAFFFLFGFPYLDIECAFLGIECDFLIFE